MKSQTFALRLPSGATIGLSARQRLTAEDLLGLHSAAHDGIIAEVDAHPSDARILGLKNLSDGTWKTEGGATQAVERGRTLRLGASRIDFGAVTAEVTQGPSSYSLTPRASRPIELRLQAKISAPMLLGLRGMTPRAAIAEVEANPQDPAVLGLKNLSAEEWAVTMPDGSRRRVPAGRAVRLANGATIGLGALQARVVAHGTSGGKAARPPVRRWVGAALPLVTWLSAHQRSVLIAMVMIAGAALGYLSLPHLPDGGVAPPAPKSTASATLDLEPLNAEIAREGAQFSQIHTALIGYHRIVQMRVTRGAASADQVPQLVRERAQALAQGSIATVSQVEEERQEAKRFFDFIESAAAGSPHWPSDQPADFYRALVSVKVARARKDHEAALTAGRNPAQALDSAYRAWALTRGEQGQPTTPFSNPEPQVYAAMGIDDAPASAPVTAPPSPWEFEMDRPGEDFSTLEMQSGNPLDCDKACEKNSDCRAFSFRYGEPPAIVPQCFLKKAVPAQHRDPCCVSAVKR